MTDSTGIGDAKNCDQIVSSRTFLLSQKMLFEQRMFYKMKLYRCHLKRLWLIYSLDVFTERLRNNIMKVIKVSKTLIFTCDAAVMLPSRPNF